MKAVKIIFAMTGALFIGSFFGIQGDLKKSNDNFIPVSFDSPFHSTSFKIAHQLSKQVWADVAFYKDFKNKCDKKMTAGCENHKILLDRIVDRVLLFQNSIVEIGLTLPTVVDDVEYICSVVEQIERDFSQISSIQNMPEYFCVKVVVGKIRHSLERLVV